MRRTPSAVLCLVAVAGPACNEATRKCHAQMTSAQEIVKNVDPKDAASVENSLAAVELALGACDAAGRTSEHDQLTRAKNELTAHADYLKRRAGRAPTKKRTPEQLAELVKQGDPGCPKGQKYIDGESKKEVRCTGPQPVDMGWEQARAYFDGRGYKLTTSDSPPTLRAEYGAELFVYTYAAPKDANPPRCLTLYPPPGMSWQEAAARATGESLRQLSKTGADTVKTQHGPVPLHVEDTATKVVVKVGECG